MTSRGPGNGAKDPPLHEQVAPDVVELHAAGHGRNEVARILGVSTATVSRAAAHAGIEFDSARTEAATRTRTRQLAQERAELADMAAELAKLAGRRLRIELGATVLDPATTTALNRVFGTATDKFLLAAEGVTGEHDKYAAARTWLDGLQLQLDAAGDGRIEPDEHGNYQFSLPAWEDES